MISSIQVPFLPVDCRLRGILLLQVNDKFNSSFFSLMIAGSTRGFGRGVKLLSHYDGAAPRCVLNCQPVMEGQG